MEKRRGWVKSRASFFNMNCCMTSDRSGGIWCMRDLRREKTIKRSIIYRRIPAAACPNDLVFYEIKCNGKKSKKIEKSACSEK